MQTAGPQSTRDIIWTLQNAVIQMIGEGISLPTIMDFICREAEQAAGNDVLCSILAVGSDKRLRTLAAPNLPLKYSQALNGLMIGPDTGSCGAAAYHGHEVTTVDLETHPNWAPYRHLAVMLNVKACWSSPIRSRAGNVIGTFAFYFRTSLGPTCFERELVACCTQLCAIAIEHEKTRAQLMSLVYGDPLSGLRNRNGYLEDLSKFAEGSAPFALLLLDLNDLKGTNDSLSHAAGDALIRAVGQRLSALGQNLICYRLGGGEFGVLVPGCRNEQLMVEWAQLILETVNQPVEFGCSTLNCYVTMGGTFCNPPIQAETIAQNADLALHQAKVTRRGGFVAFEHCMRTAIARRQDAIFVLDQALRDGRVVPFYQPITTLETAEIVSLEALVRIVNPDGTVLTAGEFHEALSDPRLAQMVTDAMLDRVAADLRSWIDRGLRFEHVGVNVSSPDFHRGDLEERITSVFSAHNVPLSYLVLEVNEAVFMGRGGDSIITACVKNLRKTEMAVALDDFGTGFASLTHLLEFPVDLLKIDQSFIQRLCHDRGSMAIVSALIEIANQMGMKIIAEGVETRDQAEQLYRMGCRFAQGFYYSPAVSFEETTELLSRFGRGTAPVSAREDLTAFRWPRPALA